MAYLIAVGTSDGVNVDLKFGQVTKFTIYKVEGTSYEVFETREVSNEQIVSCGDAKGCSKGGCSGGGNGCNGSSDVAFKVTAISDCRAVVCKKIGFQAQKQFEKKAISVFDIECQVKEALDKISFYYNKLDNRQSLRSK